MVTDAQHSLDTTISANSSAGVGPPPDDGSPPAAPAPEPSADTATHSPAHPATHTTATDDKKEAPTTHSHQSIVGSLTRKKQGVQTEEPEWQEMPSYAPYDLFDDHGRQIARARSESCSDGTSGSELELDHPGKPTNPSDKKNKGKNPKSLRGDAKVQTRYESSDEEPALDSKKTKRRQRFGSGIGHDYSFATHASHGYRRVEEADEAKQTGDTFDQQTAYLFKREDPSRSEDSESDHGGVGFDYQDGGGLGDLSDDEIRDEGAQLEKTKRLLSERERIAYVGLVRVSLAETEARLSSIVNPSLRTKAKARPKFDKALQAAFDSTALWRQATALRLYHHMDISTSEQLMMEQLHEHGVRGDSFKPALMSSGEEKGSDGPDIRWALICDLLLLLLADGTYDSRSRDLLFRVGRHLGLTMNGVGRFESKVAYTLQLARDAEADAVSNDTSDHIRTWRRKLATRRIAMMGLATVGGGLVIGLSAGLLAPVIGAGLVAGLTTVGLTSSGGFLIGAGGAAVVTTTGAVVGSTVGMRAAGNRTGAVETFRFVPLLDSRRLSIVIGVSGWMSGGADDVRLPFSTMTASQGDVYALEWEPELLRSMGATISILATEAFTQGLQQILGHTILVGLMAAVQVPVLLTKLSYLIDNPWAVSQARADAAGKILADVIASRGLGKRPVTLVGYSLGARVIFSALSELARRAESGVVSASMAGIVHNVFLFGAPVVVARDEWRRARAIVSGRFINGYSVSDWILGYLFRITGGGIQPVAGLGGVDLEGQSVTVVKAEVMENAMQKELAKAGIEASEIGKAEAKSEKGKEEGGSITKAEEGPDPPINPELLIENVDCSDIVAGHMGYRVAMPRLLRRVGFDVHADKFEEPEDLDPKDGKTYLNAQGQASVRERERLDQLLERVEQAGKERERLERLERERRLEEAKKEKKKKSVWSFFRREKEAKDEYDEEAEGERLAGPADEGSKPVQAKNEPYDSPVIFDIDAIASQANEIAKGKKNGDLDDQGRETGPYGAESEEGGGERKDTAEDIVPVVSPAPDAGESWTDRAEKEEKALVGSTATDSAPVPPPATPALSDLLTGLTVPVLPAVPAIPTGAAGMNLQKVWAGQADSDDEFAEQDVKMTFA